MFNILNLSGRRERKRSAADISSPNSSMEDQVQVNKEPNMASTPSPARTNLPMDLYQTDPYTPPPWFEPAMSNFKSEMTKAFDKQTELIQGFQSDITEIHKKLQDTDNRSTGLENGFQVMAIKLSMLEKENHEMKLRMNRLDLNSRSDTLILDGIPELGSDHTTELENLRKTLTTCLKLQPDNPLVLGLLTCHRRGRPTPPKPRSLLIHMTRDTRELIWSSRFSLGKSKTCWVRENLPEDMVRENQLLYPYFRASKSLHQSHKNTNLSRNVLRIDGKTYHVEDIPKLPDDIKTRAAAESSRGDDKVAIHYGHTNPLSNFYPATFTLEGVTYSCTEQGYHTLKADKFGDAESAARILSEKDPLKMLRMAKNIHGYNQEEWDSHKEAVMYALNKAKFQQNPPLLGFLLKTESKILGEASPSDLVWGTGLGMKDPAALQSDSWTGNNLMGKVLMRLREELQPKSD